jgi:hypothetical protein
MTWKKQVSELNKKAGLLGTDRFIQAKIVNILNILEKRGFEIILIDGSNYVFSWKAMREGISVRGDSETEDVEVFYMTDTGGYKKIKSWKWDNKTATHTHTTWKDQLEFIDAYKKPEEIKEITNRYEFVRSTIYTNKGGYASWSDACNYAQVKKLVAISGTSVSHEYITIANADVWYLVHIEGRYGSFLAAVNPEATTWIPVHAKFFGAPKEVLRQTRTVKGKLTTNDRVVITTSIELYNKLNLKEEKNE